MKITVVNVKDAYRFLKRCAFYDMQLPARVKILVGPLREYEGWFDTAENSLKVSCNLQPVELLKVVAHEMCHAVLHTSGGHWDGDHGQQFKELAAIICERMGWRKNAIL